MRLKLVGSALAVAMAILALAGTGAASADAFCRDAANPCYEGYAPPTPFTAVAKSAVFKGAGFELICKSTLQGESIANLKKGEGVNAEIANLAFSGCTGTCEGASATGLPYAMLAKATEAGNGTATASSGGEGEPGVTMSNCTELEQSCTYSIAKIPLNFIGGEGGSEAGDATLSASGVALKKVTGPCASTVSLTAEYVAEKVGIQINGSWRWEKDDPIVSWYDYEFGEVETGKTAGVIFLIEFASIEVEYGTLALINNSAGVFAKPADNCSGQRLGPKIKCSVEITATPKEEKPYESTLEAPWSEVGGSNFGTINIRLRVFGK